MIEDKAASISLLLAVFLLAPSQVASARGTGARGKERALSISINDCSLNDVAIRSPKMSLCTVRSRDLPLLVTFVFFSTLSKPFHSTLLIGAKM